MFFSFQLFDLLGFACFTLIQNILDERENLLNSFNKKTVNKDLIQAINKQPVYGCQVIVQVLDSIFKHDLGCFNVILFASICD